MIRCVVGQYVQLIEKTQGSCQNGDAMKKLIMFFGLFTFLATNIGLSATRMIPLRTEKKKTEKGEAVHWTPSPIEVFAGETVKFVVKHELKGGFDFHGFFIPVLRIAEQVTRNKTFEKEVNIPASLNPGEYEIGCQFHPSHVAAKLIVKEAPKKQ